MVREISNDAINFYEAEERKRKARQIPRQLPPPVELDWKPINHLEEVRYNLRRLTWIQMITVAAVATTDGDVDGAAKKLWAWANEDTTDEGGASTDRPDQCIQGTVSEELGQGGTGSSTGGNESEEI